jgi:single-strand DNA-binding protein
VNKISLLGRLTKEPDTKITAGDKQVCKYTLAVPRRFSKEVDFINIVAWEKQAEFCSKYFKKGQQVVVIGRIQTRNWDDDKGIRHYATEVIAEETYFADSKKTEEKTDAGFMALEESAETDLPF